MPTLATVGALAIGDRLRVLHRYLLVGTAAADSRLTLTVVDPFNKRQSVRWPGDTQIHSLSGVNSELVRLGLIRWPGRTCDIWTLDEHKLSLWDEAEDHR
jgi:hypothetical protein